MKEATAESILNCRTPAVQTVCPHCRVDAAFVGYRPHDVFTVHGPLRHHRAYYHCGACQQGHCPADTEQGLDGHWSPTLQPVVTLLGSLAPFATAQDLLRQLTGLRFSTARVRRVTERVGAEFQQQYAGDEAVPSPQAPPWDFALPDRDGRRFSGTVA